MSNSFVSKLSRSKALLAYFFLTYLDKVISFALPLAILFILKDKELYTFVEVVFSYATIAMVLLELGFSNFLFFGYKQAEDKDKFTLKAKLFFKFLLFVYGIVALLLLTVTYLVNVAFVELFILVITRSLFTLMISFYANVYRLNDKPSGIYITTISINLASLGFLMMAHIYSSEHQIVFFFLPSILLILALIFKFLLTELKLLNIKEFLLFLNNALRFSWPIILNVLAMTYMNNYAKIYAYDRLSQEETVQVSYIMRVGLIIQLTHASFSSFFSKSIFMDVSKSLNVKLLGRYSIIMGFSFLLVTFVIICTNYFMKTQVNIPLSASTLLFLLYILLWCYIGYLEIYFGVMNANRKVLYYSVICSLAYTVLLSFTNGIGLFELSLYMVLTALLNLILVIFGLSKLNVLQLKSSKNLIN